jgi:hypothetical protein
LVVAEEAAGEQQADADHRDGEQDPASTPPTAPAGRRGRVGRLPHWGGGCHAGGGCCHAGGCWVG